MPVHTPSPPTSSRPLYPAPYLRPPSQSSPTRRRRPSITTTQPRKKRKNIPSDVDIAEIRRKSDTRWKEQDLEYLSQALAGGHSYESIARHLVRSIASVHVRATRLRKAQKAMMAKQEPDTEQPVHVRTRKTGRPSTTTTHHEEPDTSDSASSSSTSTSTSASPVALIESITQQLQHPQATRPLWAATNAPYFHEAHRILPTSGDEDYIHHLKQKRLLEQQRGLYNTATFMNAWQHTFPQTYDAAAAQIQTLAAQTSYLQQQQQQQQQQQYQAMSSSSSTSASPSLSPPPPDTSTSDIGLNVPSHVTMITINNSNSILTNGSAPFVASSLPAYDYSQVTHENINNNNYDHHHHHITSTALNPATCTTPALPQFPFHYSQQQAHAQAQAQAFAAQHQSLLAQYQQAVSNGSLPANEHISIGAPLFQTPDFNFLQHTHTMPT